MTGKIYLSTLVEDEDGELWLADEDGDILPAETFRKHLGDKVDELVKRSVCELTPCLVHLRYDICIKFLETSVAHACKEARKVLTGDNDFRGFIEVEWGDPEE